MRCWHTEPVVGRLLHGQHHESDLGTLQARLRGFRLSDGRPRHHLTAGSSIRRPQFDFELLNAGQYLIEHVDLRVGDIDVDALNVAAFPEAAEWQESLGSAFPGAILKGRVRVPVPATDSFRGYPVVVLFTDTWDQRWVKVVDGNLVRIGSPDGRAEDT